MTRHYLTFSIIIASLVAAMIYRHLREPIGRLARVGGTAAAAIVPHMLAVSLPVVIGDQFRRHDSAFVAAGGTHNPGARRVIRRTIVA
jgi:hypothetical protein